MQPIPYSRGRSARLVLVFLVAVAASMALGAALMAALGGTPSGRLAVAPDPSIPSVVLPHVPAGAGPGTGIVAPDPGILDARPATIDHYVLSQDKSTVQVFYYGGVDTCYGLADARASWKPDGTLDIQVFEGRRAGVDEACIDIAELKVITLQLTRDLPLWDQ